MGNFEFGEFNTVNCIFCKIINHEIASTIVYQDEHVLAFNDNNPQAPQHKLIVPREHISSLDNVPPERLYLLHHLFAAAQKIARDLAIAEEGYRLVMNCNAAGGQTVAHVHLHLLGGRHMVWPPG
jgi:histidine triad (HIT) family protein